MIKSKFGYSVKKKSIDGLRLEVTVMSKKELLQNMLDGFAFALPQVTIYLFEKDEHFSEVQLNF